MLRKIKFASEAKKLLSKNGVHHGIQFHSNRPAMTIAVDLGRKATKQTIAICYGKI